MAAVTLAVLETEQPETPSANPRGALERPAPAWMRLWPVHHLVRLLWKYRTQRRRRPRRVVLSYTSELATFPASRPFVAAAEAAVSRAEHVIVGMGYLSAADANPADRSASMVASGDVYVGIIGSRFGGLVPGREDQSFTQLEYETATFLRMTRLVFVIDGSALPPTDQPEEHCRLQEAFRARLEEVTFATVASPDELELHLYQALVEWDPPARVTPFRRMVV